MVGVNLTNIQYKDMQRCHNESPVQLVYANKNALRKKACEKNPHAFSLSSKSHLTFPIYLHIMMVVTYIN
jgi:hypothetical protein